MAQFVFVYAVSSKFSLLGYYKPKFNVAFKYLNSFFTTLAWVYLGTDNSMMNGEYQTGTKRGGVNQYRHK